MDQEPVERKQARSAQDVGKIFSAVVLDTTFR
jgi:hypothetical protein